MQGNILSSELEQVRSELAATEVEYAVGAGGIGTREADFVGDGGIAGKSNTRRKLSGAYAGGSEIDAGYRAGCQLRRAY